VSPPTARRIAFLGVALAGTLVGHTLTYVLAIRPVAHRGEHLARAGHSYWGAAVWLVSAVVACGILALILSALRRRRMASDAPAFWRSASVLVVSQVTGFLVLEGLERTASGAGFGDLIHHDLILVGLLAQIVVALAGAMLLRWLMRAAHLLAALSPPPTAGRAPAPFPSPGQRIRPRPVMPLGGWGLRGPPLVLPR